MKKLLTDEFTILTGAADEKDHLLLLAEYDTAEKQEVPHTAVLLVNDDRIEDKILLEWRSSGTCVLAAKTFFVFGEYGDYLLYEAGDTKVGNVFEETQAERRGIMRNGAMVSGADIVWVGLSGLCFRKEGSAAWKPFNRGLSQEILLDGIVSSRENLTFAFGRDGSIFRLVKDEWIQEEVPTNQTLTCGTSAPDGRVFIAGLNGIILCGFHGQWDTVAGDATKEDIWGVCWFEDKLFVSTMSFVYVVEDRVLELVNYQDQIPETCYQIVSGGTTLWSIGAKDLFRFKNYAWNRIDLRNPLNE